MKHQGNYYLCTIKELATLITEIINKGLSDGSSWFNDSSPMKSFKSYFDFSQTNACEAEEIDDLKYAAFKAEGWYGIRAIDTGFDSVDLDFACDYYGGTCLSTGSVYEGMETEEMIQMFVKMISTTLSYMEGCDIKKSLLIVDYHDNAEED